MKLNIKQYLNLFNINLKKINKMKKIKIKETIKNTFLFNDNKKFNLTTQS